jgi:flagellar protein FliS
MTNNDQYNAYQKANQTVSEIQQVIMLYEGAINFIEQAKEAIIEKNYEKRYNLINKAIAIVTGLNSCLDFNDETNDVANALDQYYQSLDMRLLYIQCDNNIDSCNEVIEDLRVMLNAWKDVVVETNEADAAENEQLSIPPGALENGGKIDVEITV